MQSLDRRRFLGSLASAALLGAGMLPGRRSAAAAEQTAARRRMTIDLRCGSIGVRADQRRAIELAASHGFESVEADPQFFAGLSAGDLKGFRDDLQKRALVLGAAGLPVDFRGAEDRFAADLDRLDGLAAGLERAGVTRIGTWIRPTHPTLTYLQNFKQHVSRLDKVAEVLEPRKLRLGLEYVGPKTSWAASRHPFIHTLAEIRELIAAIGRPNVGIVLDSWHWYTAGESAKDILGLRNEDVVAVDLNDAPAGIPVDQQIDSRRELPSATGVIDLKGFLGALLEIGYDGPVHAEPFNEALNRLGAEEAVAATAAAMKKAFALIPG